MTDLAVIEKAKSWLGEAFDPETRAEVQRLLDDNGSELVDAFYKDLEFGTGGLRGIMGAGTNKMNIYTVGMATQGLANYLKNVYGSAKISVAIAHDSRNNSRLFAETTANVFSANGIHVHLFESLRPTPELSFAVRELKAQAGVVVTASHNPKEYNGYKVYWEDGGQLVPPHDKNTIAEVRKISGPEQVKFTPQPELIHALGSEMDELYWNKVAGLSLSNEGKDQVKIVYTPIHGTGINGVPQVLKKMGFSQVSVLESQAQPDGNFPTVHSPNPEEAAALNLAIEYAGQIQADLVLGTDPDSDRVGIAVRDQSGEMILMNGNETAAVLVHYVLSQMKAKNALNGNPFVAKTIVTTDLIAEIANHFGVRVYECLTGFKYIAELIRENEGKETYLVGGEESYGYLVSDFVRDKDAVSSAAMIAEAAAWAKGQGMSLLDYLESIHREFDAFQEALVSITKKGKSGAEEIQQMMDDFRNKPLKAINGYPVIITRDYASGIETDLRNGGQRSLGLPSSNVFQFVLQDRTIVTARPSGTEPKIKFYISVRDTVMENDTYEVDRVKLQEKIQGVKNALGL
ncbi:MAG: phospho-sugar mutase [Bacteroidota bacterium]|nr:phospho-sugar mutase [Bacteroidota bacterium]MDX5430509.1 phospho-sugar mutase [Bacteroidota bacterium]MDX5469265.1 phospho-sugar mutase [Bacteroidota bacterium]